MVLIAYDLDASFDGRLDVNILPFLQL